MAKGRLKHNWDETSNILAALANIFRDHRRGKIYRAIELNPYRDEKHEAQKASIHELKSLLQSCGVIKDG